MTAPRATPKELEWVEHVDPTVPWLDTIIEPETQQAWRKFTLPLFNGRGYVVAIYTLDDMTAANPGHGPLIAHHLSVSLWLAGVPGPVSDSMVEAVMATFDFGRTWWWEATRRKDTARHFYQPVVYP